MDKLKQYDSVDVAKLMRALAFKQGIVLNVTQIQKLLFIVHGYYLAMYDHRILTEQPKAWPYGPVFPRARKKVDYSKVDKISDPEIAVITKDKELKNVLNEIIKQYSDFNASQLVEWSHENGSPWEVTKRAENFKWNDPIGDHITKTYFQENEIL